MFFISIFIASFPLHIDTTLIYLRIQIYILKKKKIYIHAFNFVPCKLQDLYRIHPAYLQISPCTLSPNYPHFSQLFIIFIIHFFHILYIPIFFFFLILFPPVESATRIKWVIQGKCHTRINISACSYIYTHISNARVRQSPSQAVGEIRSLNIL